MKNIRHEVSVWIQTVTLIGIWLLLLYISGTRALATTDALSKIPDVVLIYGALYWIFTRWAWRLRIFQGWLVPFPDLQGTWLGTLQTTWKNAAGVVPGPIPVKLVIRQTFSGITCSMFTAESASRSTAAAFASDEEAGIRKISYVYTNIPKVGVRDRSAVHQGAVDLTVVVGPVNRLEGEYWTNRKSTGEFIVAFRDSTLDESFE